MPKLLKAASPTAVKFVRRTVTLQGREAGTDCEKQVEAECIGGIAVHEVVFSDDVKKLKEERFASRLCWCVSSANCGLRMVAFLPIDAARRVAAWLYKEWGEVFERLPSRPTDAQRQCVRNLPAWVVAWCRAVQRERIWLEPDEFKNKSAAPQPVAKQAAATVKLPAVAAGSVPVQAARKML